MGAAVALRDIVREAEDIFIIAVVPLERDVDADAVAFAADRDRIGQQRILVAVEIFDEGRNPALVEQVVDDMFGVARIDQLDPYARIEKGELAIAMFQLFEIELGDILEGIGRCHEGDAGALLARRRRPVDLERRNRIAMLEAHPMLFAIAPDRQFEPFAERVDDRYADAVQTARHLIGIVVARVLELPARVKLGHDDLGRRNAFLGMDAGRDAAPIVLDADRSVAVERD